MTRCTVTVLLPGQTVKFTRGSITKTKNKEKADSHTETDLITKGTGTRAVSMARVNSRRKTAKSMKVISSLVNLKFDSLNFCVFCFLILLIH